MEKIRFAEKDYRLVENYLNENSQSKKKSDMMGVIYFNGQNEMMFLQKRKLENRDDGKVYVILSNNHSELNKLKKDLGDLILE